MAERHDWPLEQSIDELDRGDRRAGPVIAAANGRLDVIALGEGVHAGDVRAALGIAPAYAVEGTDDAPALLAACSRARNTPLPAAHLPDRDVLMGTWLPHQKTPAGLAADTDALVRLYTGRPIGDSSFTLRGAAPAELVCRFPLPLVHCSRSRCGCWMNTSPAAFGMPWPKAAKRRTSNSRKRKTPSAGWCAPNPLPPGP